MLIHLILKFMIADSDLVFMHMANWDISVDIEFSV